MESNKSVKVYFKEYLLLNRFSKHKRKSIIDTTPTEIIKRIEKLSLKQREQLGMY